MTQRDEAVRSIELPQPQQTCEQTPGTADVYGNYNQILYTYITVAVGQCAPAFVLNKSSRDMPGFRGMPAGMITRSQPLRQAPSSSRPVCALTVIGVLQWLRSVATPSTPAMSYNANSVISLFIFSRRASGCPMPPPEQLHAYA